MNIKLTLATKKDPLKIKGFDSTVNAIVDYDNNLICLAPVTMVDRVYDCLTMKEKTDKLFTVLSRMTDDEVHLCSACKRKEAESSDEKTEYTSNTVCFPQIRYTESKTIPM